MMENKYHELLPLLRLLEVEAKHCLETALACTDIRIHMLNSRVKSFESTQKKLEKKEQSGAELSNIDALTDLVGLRVVCLFLGDIEKIGEVIKECFEIVNLDDKLASSDSSIFGYQGVHFVAKIKEEYIGPRYDAVKHQCFEIQVRTITMDAWAAASHYLDYKNEKGVPSALRKDFFALSGLFYVADTHFEMFYGEAQKSKINTEDKSQSRNELLSKEINLDTIRYYLKYRFPDRVESSIEGVSDLTDEIIDAGYKNLAELDKDITRGYTAFERYEIDHPPGVFNKKKKKSTASKSRAAKFADIGVARVTLELTSDKYIDARKARGTLSSTMLEMREEYRKFLKP